VQGAGHGVTPRLVQGLEPLRSPSPRVTSDAWQAMITGLIVSVGWYVSETWARPKMWPNSCVAAASMLHLDEQVEGFVTYQW
jgi:hypothetical protein